MFAAINVCAFFYEEDYFTIIKVRVFMRNICLEEWLEHFATINVRELLDLTKFAN